MTDLLHKRLAHFSERRLQELRKQGLLGSDALDRLTFCNHCVYGKARVRFSTAVQRTKDIVNYIQRHSEL